jgi:predicted dehydrogenase
MTGWTRREFIRRTASLAGVPLLSRCVGRRADDRREGSLGVALVGLGNLSTHQLAPALQKTTRCHLAGIVTGTPAKAVAWKARYGIPDRSIYDYQTMERMADNPDIDIVYVVTPNALHAEHAIHAARAGKHVLCEKPMEVSVERCQAMIAACRQAGRRLAIGYRCRFEPLHLECARLAREHVRGRPRKMEAGFGFAIGDPAQWRLRRALSGGGALVDVGIYALQSARMMTGEEPVRITAQEVKTDRVKFAEVDETMAFRLTFASGVVASCSTTYRVPGLNRMTVYADRGSYGLAPAYNYAGNRGWRSDGAPLAFDPIDPFAAEMDDFARCITTGEPSRVPGEEGLRDVRLMMAIYQAARTGTAVGTSS